MRNTISRLQPDNDKACTFVNSFVLTLLNTIVKNATICSIQW